MHRHRNLLRAKRLSAIPATLLSLLFLAGPSHVAAQDRAIPNTPAKPRVPIYDPGQPIQRKVLKNGVRLLVQEQRTSDKVAGVIAIKAGTRYEREDESGVSQILMRSLLGGTRKYDPAQLQLELIAAEVSLESGAGADMGQISMTTTRERVTKAIDLLAEITLRPTFPDTSFDAGRTYFLGRASDDVEGPLSGTYAIYLRTMFQGSPFERPAFGRIHSISECRRGDMIALYRRLFVGGNITVCLVGNFDGPKVMSQLEKAFASAPSGAPPAPVMGDPTPLASDTLVSEDRPYVAQSLTYGYPAPGYDDPDYPAFLMIDSYLRSGDRSPITYWLPERRLASSVGVLYPRYPKHSSIAVYLGATPDKWKAARDTVVAVFHQLATYPMGQGDWPVHLRRVQNGFFNDQSNPVVRARELSRYETQNLGLDYPQKFEARLLALKPEDVRDAAARWFTHACEVTLIPTGNGSRP
ncbi:MAG: M16 family metallopeptidase [Candidatus Eiseniibacteriota bacterium]